MGFEQQLGGSMAERIAKNRLDQAVEKPAGETAEQAEARRLLEGGEKTEKANEALREGERVRKIKETQRTLQDLLERNGTQE